jgi:hypothetical protein
MEKCGKPVEGFVYGKVENKIQAFEDGTGRLVS